MKHPFEPLDEEELRRAAAAVRDDPRFLATHRFFAITVLEPEKGRPTEGDRRAEVVLVDRGAGTTTEVTVDLASGRVDRWSALAGCHAAYLLEEYMLAIDAVKADPRWLAALKSRGVDDVETVQHDPWPAGNFGGAGEQGRRLMRVVAYVRHHEADNGYAHPIEGLVATIDVTSGEVLEVIDDAQAGPAPAIPIECANYDETSVGGYRNTLKPLEITQPDGPSFTVEGSAIAWENWRLRASMHPLDALVLHEVGWDDGTRVRSILHRASLAEMVVPYGDIGVGHRWKNAFDSGEIAMGRYPFLNSLKLGCDCLGEIRYLDALHVSEAGRPQRTENAICIHEEDYGILWKHTDRRLNVPEVRRSRRLVISSVSTVENYEYGFFWYLYQDGNIQLEVKLTGVLSLGAFPEGEKPKYGVLVAPQVYAPNHQHFFNVRLDFDLDGTANTVQQVDVVADEPSDANPFENAFRARAMNLRTEKQARANVNVETARTWKIINPAVLNAVGEPVGYKLIPGDNSVPFASKNAWWRKRAGFVNHHVWVTPYREDEKYGAGDYPNQSAGGDGLIRWTEQDRPIENTDVVLWYTFGHTHLPRPEDYPVMPAAYIGFMLKPNGFFDLNPANDLPPSAKKANKGGCCH
jgi:primary-amine oxidase